MYSGFCPVLKGLSARVIVKYLYSESIFSSFAKYYLPKTIADLLWSISDEMRRALHFTYCFIARLIMQLSVVQYLVDIQENIADLVLLHHS